MKNFALIACLALGLGLAGCATTTDPTTGQTTTTLDPTGVQATISKVQTVTATLCRFIPTAATVAGILTKGSPNTIASAETIANAICSALAPAQSARLRGAPMVDGVVIHGTFLK